MYFTICDFVLVMRYSFLTYLNNLRLKPVKLSYILQYNSIIYAMSRLLCQKGEYYFCSSRF